MFSPLGVVRHDDDPLEVLRLPLGGDQDEGPDYDRDGGQDGADHEAQKDQQHPGRRQEKTRLPAAGEGHLGEGEEEEGKIGQRGEIVRRLEF